MKPNLLMRAWMMAHVYGAEYQAVVCYAGSSGEVAFRESLCPQYTSDRHDANGLRTYHITGTCGDASIRRIACGHIGTEIVGASTGPLRITITSNTHSWQFGDLSENENLLSLDLDMLSIVRIAPEFLYECFNLRCINLTSLRAVEVLPDGFLHGCSSLEKVDLSPLTNLRAVGGYFMSGCAAIKFLDLTPLRAVEVLPEEFLSGCSGLEEVDLSPLVNLREVDGYFMSGCGRLKSIDLTPLRAVEMLPHGCLSVCTSLEEVDLRPLINLAEVSEECLQNCPSLKAVRLAPHHPTDVVPRKMQGLVVREKVNAPFNPSSSNAA